MRFREGQFREGQFREGRHKARHGQIGIRKSWERANCTRGWVTALLTTATWMAPVALGWALPLGAMGSASTMTSPPPRASADATAPIASTSKPQTIRGRAGGGRGCASSTPPSDLISAQPPLRLLTQQPENKITTRSPRPTFAWYVRDAGAWPLEFRIYRQPSPSAQAPDSAAELVVELKHDSFRSHPGIMTFTLPESLPPLAPGDNYLWQVEMICDLDESSSTIFAEAWLEVLPVVQANVVQANVGPANVDRANPGEESNPALDNSMVVSFYDNGLTQWLDQRRQGQAAERQFSWADLGLSQAEAETLEQSPVHGIHIQFPTRTNGAQ